MRCSARSPPRPRRAAPAGWLGRGPAPGASRGFPPRAWVRAPPELHDDGAAATRTAEARPPDAGARTRTPTRADRSGRTPRTGPQPPDRVAPDAQRDLAHGSGAERGGRCAHLGTP